MTFLDYLVEFLGVQYLSDLHYISITPVQAEALKRLPSGRFQKSDYTEAAEYLKPNGPLPKKEKDLLNAVVKLLQSPK